MRLHLPIGLPIILFLLLFTGSAMAAPQADLWSRWLAHDPKSTASVDHDPWDRFLDTYVIPGEDGINRVAYSRVTRAHRENLDGYIAELTETPVSQLNRAEQQAFWINLYNALTVQVILDYYPVESIRDINISPGLFSGLFSQGPWDKKLVTIEGEQVSLNDIEHRILRPIWQDPRIHYTVNCAAMGCPNLQIQAFTAENTDELMDKEAREYINHPRGARVEDRGLIVSSIYHWYKEDFDGTDSGVIVHLQRYAEPALKSQLERFNHIADHEYDWSLNDVR